jgi:hypothetical protein
MLISLCSIDSGVKYNIDQLAGFYKVTSLQDDHNMKSDSVQKSFAIKARPKTIPIKTCACDLK